MIICYKGWLNNDFVYYKFFNMMYEFNNNTKKNNNNFNIYKCIYKYLITIEINDIY